MSRRCLEDRAVSEAPDAPAGTDSPKASGSYDKAEDLMEHSREALIDVKAAAALLGIKPQTLYTYVSRGLIRTAPRSGAAGSLYHREDVDALLLRSRSGSFSGAAAEQAIRWGGGEVLRSAITSIGPSGPRYCGKLAIDLARGQHHFEDCVELLCTGTLLSRNAVWPVNSLPASFHSFSAPLTEIALSVNWRKLFALLVQAYSVCIDQDDEQMLGSALPAARSLIQLLAPGFGLLDALPGYRLCEKTESIAETVARSGGASCSSEALHAINACLILSADHELAPSTFAARIAASAGADIFSCVNSALGAFEGLGCDQSERMLRSADSPGDYIYRLKQYGRHKEMFPGYNHPLYPAGDPRALYLLELARDMNPKNADSIRVLACIDAAMHELGMKPGLGIGLIAVATIIGLPRRSPGALMALGRTSGWVAHVYEQRRAGFVVRPRARYIGPSD
jgi:citrate synthase